MSPSVGLLSEFKLWPLVMDTGMTSAKLASRVEEFDGSELVSVCPSKDITAPADSALNLKDSSSRLFSGYARLKFLHS